MAESESAIESQKTQAQENLNQNQDESERECPQESGEQSQQPKIELNAHFPSFIALRGALDKYQKENRVQLIVKDSKLLSSESTKRIIPKVYHLVNQSLMYHSITYYCKYHGELKQKAGSRIKKIGAKRLNCPMYLRFKLSTDLQSLVLFDMLQTHNHEADPNTFTLSPRQQVYRLSAIQRGEPDPGDVKNEPARAPQSEVDVQTLIATAIRDVNSISSLSQSESDYVPPAKAACLAGNAQNNEPTASSQAKRNEDVGRSPNKDNVDNSDEDDEEDHDDIIYKDNPNSPLDPESSCSDSDEEEFRRNRDFLPYPIRLFGAAIQCNPELLSLTKELIESQKEKIQVAKQKLVLETELLKLKNAKLSMEVKNLEKTLATTPPDQPTTFFLQN